jgi:hypothetical protein
MEGSVNPIREIQALKFVSLRCFEMLQRFHAKVKPSEDSLGAQSEMSKLREASRMVRWQLLVKKLFLAGFLLILYATHTISHK